MVLASLDLIVEAVMAATPIKLANKPPVEVATPLPMATAPVPAEAPALAPTAGVETALASITDAAGIAGLTGTATWAK